MTDAEKAALVDALQQRLGIARRQRIRVQQDFRGNTRQFVEPEFNPGAAVRSVCDGAARQFLTRSQLDQVIG